MNTKITTIIGSLFCAVLPLMAQSDTNTVEMADVLHKSGKIYVVVAVIAVIFAGIIAFLFMLERRINRLEEDVKNKNNKQGA